MIWGLLAALVVILVLTLGVISIGSAYLEQREFNGYLQSQNDILMEQLTSVMTAALEYMEEEVSYDDPFETITHFDA